MFHASVRIESAHNFSQLSISCLSNSWNQINCAYLWLYADSQHFATNMRAPFHIKLFNKLDYGPNALIW